MSYLELKIPPLLLVLLFGVLMWGVSELFLPLQLMFDTRIFVAGVLFFLAIMLLAASVLSFWRASTTVNPTAPENASFIVTSGVYRISRNPMYLAFLLLLIAWGVVLSNVLSFFLLPAFVLYMNRFQIKPEERVLSEKFGAEYDAYQIAVRRWI